MKDEISDNWISLEEAANYLGIKVVTLRNWLKRGNGIPANRIGKLWKFKKAELDLWVRSGRSSIENSDGECHEN